MEQAANDNAAKPTVGMGATVQLGSDCTAYTVIQVSPSGYRLVLQEDRAVPTQLMREEAERWGFGGTQQHVFVQDPEGACVVATLRGDGRYRMTGARGYGLVRLGVRERYRDPTF